MSALAATLLALAVADLVGGHQRRHDRPHRWVASAAGAGTLLVVGLLAGLGTGADIALLALGAVVVTGWELVCARSFAREGEHWLPLSVLAAGFTLLVLLFGHASPAAGLLSDWLRWADVPPLAGVGADRVLLVTGLFGVQLSTGNVLVRLVLRQAGTLGATGPQPSDRLRGGRLLGPMERVVILGLGLAGQVTAASLVIAAKGLIRWPELQDARRSPPGSATDPFPGEGRVISVDEVTEYFLIGSFVSWLVAMGALLLAA